MLGQRLTRRLYIIVISRVEMRELGGQTRILFLAEGFQPEVGGVADYNANLADALVDAGHDVVVIAPHVTGDEVTDERAAFRMIRVGERDIRNQRLGIAARFWAVRQTLKQTDAVVEQLMHVWPPTFAIVSPLSMWAMVCERRNLPYALCIHGGDAFGRRADFLRTVYRKWVVKQRFSRAHRIFANSNFTTGLILKNGLLTHKVHTTYCGVPRTMLDLADQYEKRRIHKSSGHRLLTMCRLVRFKACDTVIAAVKELSTKYPDLTLTVAGDGPERAALEQQARSLGIASRILFVGYVEGTANKVKLFYDHDIFVHGGRFDPVTRRVENFGIVFAEAAACSRPAVGAQIGGIPEVITHGETGLLVEPDDAESMVHALDQLLQDPARAAALGRAARKKVDQVFSYERIAQTIVDAMR